MAKTCNSCGLAVNDAALFCEKCGYQFASDPKANLPSDPQVASSGIVQPGQAIVQCKTCDSGQLHLNTNYRMSTPVVAIGYILLIPSILGMLVTLFMLVLMLVESFGIPAANWLNPLFVDWVRSLPFPVIFFLCVGVSFFISGLVGWLLVMKKKVLRCSNCGATVAAS